MSEVTLVGYGNQGKAWAANLRDSGWKVRVSGRTKSQGGKGHYASQQDGFSWIEPTLLREEGGIIVLLLPDEEIADFFAQYLAPASMKNQTENEKFPPTTFVFAHGYSVTFHNLPFQANDAVVLVAPKGIGKKLRENYLAGSGVMAVLGVEQDPAGNAWEIAKSLATGLGCARVKLLRSSFREETMADLLSEQTVLCGPVPLLVEESIQFLVAKGIDPELATYECLNELKLIVDMMVERGIAGMFQGISRTAKFGGLRAAEHILPKAKLHSSLEKLWMDIESGKFAEEFAEDRKLRQQKNRMGEMRGRESEQNL